MCARVNEMRTRTLSLPRPRSRSPTLPPSRPHPPPILLPSHPALPSSRPATHPCPPPFLRQNRRSTKNQSFQPANRSPSQRTASHRSRVVVVKSLRRTAKLTTAFKRLRGLSTAAAMFLLDIAAPSSSAFATDSYVLRQPSEFSFDCFLLIFCS